MKMAHGVKRSVVWLANMRLGVKFHEINACLIFFSQ
jgi:hypothetical protein